MVTDGKLVAGALAGKSGSSCFKVLAEEKTRIKLDERAEAKKLIAPEKKIDVKVTKKTKPTAAKKKVIKSVKKAAAVKKVGAKTMKKVAKAPSGAKAKKGAAKPKKVAKKAKK